MCYATRVNRGNKFSPRAIPSVYLGYSTSQKVYILLDLCLKDLYISRDTVFQEDVFPFKSQKSKLSPLFPVFELPIKESSANNHSSGPSSTKSTSNIDTLPVVSDIFVNDSSILPVRSTSTVSSEVIRRSTRHIRPPTWMSDYVVPAKTSMYSYPLENYLSYEQVTPSYRDTLNAFSAIVEPFTFAKASINPL